MKLHRIVAITVEPPKCPVNTGLLIALHFTAQGKSDVLNCVGANIASLITREKRRGFKICIREVEKDAAIARMCIYEMEEKPALPDLSWGSKKRVKGVYS